MREHNLALTSHCLAAENVTRLENALCVCVVTDFDWNSWFLVYEKKHVNTLLKRA